MAAKADLTQKAFCQEQSIRYLRISFWYEPLSGGQSKAL